MEKTTHSLLIHIFGDFNAGWMYYVMGLDKPSDPIMAEGFEMAEETPSLQSMRHIMETQSTLPAGQRQYTVEAHPLEGSV